MISITLFDALVYLVPGFLCYIATTLWLYGSDCLKKPGPDLDPLLKGISILFTITVLGLANHLVSRHISSVLYTIINEHPIFIAQAHFSNLGDMRILLTYLESRFALAEADSTEVYRYASLIVRNHGEELLAHSQRLGGISLLCLNLILPACLLYSAALLSGVITKKRQMAALGVSTAIVIALLAEGVWDYAIASALSYLRSALVILTA